MGAGGAGGSGSRKQTTSKQTTSKGKISSYIDDKFGSSGGAKAPTSPKPTPTVSGTGGSIAGTVQTGSPIANVFNQNTSNNTSGGGTSTASSTPTVPKEEFTTYHPEMLSLNPYQTFNETYTYTPYEGVNYDQKKYEGQFDNSFYRNQTDLYTQQANKERANQLGEAQKQQQNALKSAYLQRVQNENALGQSLAALGIRGGASESSNIKLANQYGQSVQAANTDYSNSVNSINQSIDRNIFDYTMDMNARENEDRKNFAQMLWNAEREDSKIKNDQANEANMLNYNTRREENANAQSFNQQNAIAMNEANNAARLNQYNAAVEYWYNAGVSRFAKSQSVDSLKKTLDTLNKALDKAKTQDDKLYYRQMIRACSERIGALNTLADERKEARELAKFNYNLSKK